MRACICFLHLCIRPFGRSVSSLLNLICGNPCQPEPLCSESIPAEVALAFRGLRDRSGRITPSKGDQPTPNIVNIAFPTFSLLPSLTTTALKCETSLESCLVSITHILSQDPCYLPHSQYYIILPLLILLLLVLLFILNAGLCRVFARNYIACTSTLHSYCLSLGSCLSISDKYIIICNQHLRK